MVSQIRLIKKPNTFMLGYFLVFVFVVFWFSSISFFTFLN